MLSSLIQQLGLHPTRVSPVHGGDINQAFKVFRGEQAFFIKINEAAAFPGMMEKEARGLEALQKESLFKIPKVDAVGEWEGIQYLVLKWLAPAHRQADFWQRFGAALAHQHLQKQTAFGWTEDNYIGRLPQSNRTYANWTDFYLQERIRPLVQLLVDRKQFSTGLPDRLEKLRTVIQQEFPTEPPALLHGDLWSGNISCTGDGYPTIFDPAVYAGHREMDIGMTQLFGGFDSSFIEAYQHYYPLENHWRKRLPLTQLYPILVHAVLFGGQYVQEARSIITSY
jgi:fructosamine-3-kinase